MHTLPAPIRCGKIFPAKWKRWRYSKAHMPTSPLRFSRAKKNTARSCPPGTTQWCTLMARSRPLQRRIIAPASAAANRSPRGASRRTVESSVAPEAFLQPTMHAVVGIKIPISKLMRKWKVSQNWSMANRRKVALGLGRDAYHQPRHFGGAERRGNEDSGQDARGAPNPTPF